MKKCIKTLFALVLLVAFAGIVISQYCLPRCPLSGQIYCPSPCYASRQYVPAIYCCTRTVQGNNICCWYKGYGLLCQGPETWCGKYVQGYGDQFDRDEFGVCTRDSQHNLYCDTTQ